MHLPTSEQFPRLCGWSLQEQHARLPGDSVMSQWCLCHRDRMCMLRGAAVILVRWMLTNLTASGIMESRAQVLCVSFYFGVTTEELHGQHYGS